MSHPLGINYLQQDNSLELTHNIRAVLCFLCLEYLSCLGAESVYDVLLGNVAQIVLVVVKVLGTDEPAHEVLSETNKVPVVLYLIVNKIAVNCGLDEIL